MPEAIIVISVESEPILDPTPEWNFRIGIVRPENEDAGMKGKQSVLQ